MLPNAHGPELLRLACTNCGAPLVVSPDESVSRCLYCSSQHLVTRTAAGIYLKPVLKRLDSVEKLMSDGARANARVADELTLQRIVKERAEADAQGAKALKEAESIRQVAVNNQNLAFLSFLAAGVFGLVAGFGTLGLFTRGTDAVGPAGGGLAAAVLALLFGVALVQSSKHMKTTASSREQEIRKNLEGWRVYEQQLRERLSKW